MIANSPPALKNTDLTQTEQILSSQLQQINSMQYSNKVALFPNENKLNLLELNRHKMANMKPKYQTPKNLEIRRKTNDTGMIYRLCEIKNLRLLPANI